MFQEIEVILKEKWGKKDAKAREREMKDVKSSPVVTHTPHSDKTPKKKKNAIITTDC